MNEQNRQLFWDMLSCGYRIY